MAGVHRIGSQHPHFVRTAASAAAAAIVCAGGARADRSRSLSLRGIIDPKSGFSELATCLQHNAASSIHSIDLTGTRVAKSGVGGAVSLSELISALPQPLQSLRLSDCAIPSKVCIQLFFSRFSRLSRLAVVSLSSLISPPPSLSVLSVHGSVPLR